MIERSLAPSPAAPAPEPRAPATRPRPGLSPLRPGAPARAAPAVLLALFALLALLALLARVATAPTSEPARPLVTATSTRSKNSTAGQARGTPRAAQPPGSVTAYAADHGPARSDLGARFTAAGVRLSVATGTLRLSPPTLSDSAGQPPARGPATTRIIRTPGRVTYRDGTFTEWYRPRAGGLEQGFTLPHPPAGLPASGRVTLAIGLSGSLRPRQVGAQVRFAAPHAAIALTYGQLSATDATGRRLSARIELRPGSLRLRIDTRGARYPVRVDPLIEGGSAPLPPHGETPAAEFGASGSLDSAGNRALIGAPGDRAGLGAAWLFGRAQNAWIQLAGPLLPAGAAGASRFGAAGALAGDGKLALIGGPGRRRRGGAAWVFAAVDGWTQQGAKLTPSPDPAGAAFGSAVALSAGGQTALIGAPGDSAHTGAAWIYTRHGQSWAASVVLRPTRPPAPARARASSDRRSRCPPMAARALIGAPGSGGRAGAAWVFTRAGAAWSQTGSELAVPGLAPASALGAAVALSADGRTALLGAPGDDGAGAAWVFARAGSGWGRGEAKLSVGAGGGATGFGSSVALSSNGDRALLGAPGTSQGAGAAWLFTRTRASWSPQKPDLIPSRGTAAAAYGSSTSLSAQGGTALVGDPAANAKAGATWAVQISTVAPAPSCFGAAALDPVHPCSSRALADTVIPTPDQALITPSAPCTILETDRFIQPCAFGVPPASATATVALLGDSHAIHWRAALEVVAQAKRWTAISVVRSGCPYTTATGDLSEALRRECVEADREIPATSPPTRRSTRCSWPSTSAET